MSDLFGNRQKQSLAILAMIVIAIIVVPMWNRDPDSPETQVRTAVQTLVKAAEKEDMGPFRELLSQKVKDSNGRSREEILKTLFAIFFQYKQIKLTQVNLDIVTGTQPDVITANLTLLMGASSPLPSDKGNFVLTFRKEDDTWRVWEIDWEDGAQYAD